MNLVLLFLPVSIMAAQYLFQGSAKNDDPELNPCGKLGLC